MNDPTTPPRATGAARPGAARISAWTLGVVIATLGCGRCPGEDRPQPPRVTRAEARLSPSGVGAVYLRIDNPGPRPLRLASATCAGVERVELHESVLEGRVASMIPRPEGFVVPARGHLVLAPGGRHLMLFGTPEASDAPLELTLDFADGRPVALRVPVRPLGAR